MDEQNSVKKHFQEKLDILESRGRENRKRFDKELARCARENICVENEIRLLIRDAKIAGIIP